ncbi:MAG: hypothetical protein JFAIHJKO_02103 [Pyrinomonadaceae bacterium]|nr:hypothetical protein [Pyrinomonadaceae bacterium]
MRKLMLSFFASAIFAATAVAQNTTSPAAKPTPDTDVVRITSTLVQLDVSVTDKEGRPIKDLRPEEIHLFENGKERKLSGVSFVPGAPPADNNEMKKSAAPVGPVLPGRQLAANEVRRTIAIVVDDVTLSFQSIDYTREVLRRFVDQQMRDGDLVAIIRSGAGVGALQQFTSDKRQLYAAIDRIRWNAVANGRISTFDTVEGQQDDSNQIDVRAQQEDAFVAGSLGALNYVIRGMDKLPGRKSVLMISEGFRLFDREPGGQITQGNVIDSVRAITDAANRAAVVIYTLDPRGLVVPMVGVEENPEFWSLEDIDRKMSRQGQALIDTQDGLSYLSEETGGFTIKNTNNLSKGIRKILDDQSYYLVAYEPEEGSFDPKKLRFNKIEIKVDRPGTKVRYRSGFFNVGDNTLKAAKQPTPFQSIADALLSPFAQNDLPIRYNGLFNYDHKNGAYLRSLVHMNIGDLDFKTLPDGKRQASLDIFAYAFGVNGAIEGRLQKTYKLTVPPEAFEKLRSTGFVYDFVFPIAKPGAYQLRVVVRDSAADKVGSASQFVEIPNLKKNRLTLSGIVLNSGTPTTSSSALTATALREFHRGASLDYGSVALNARADSLGKTNLTSRLRIFRDGKLIFTGQPQSVAQGQQPADSVAFMGSINLGTKLEAGDYVMEVAVTDTLAKGKYATALQYVEFRVVE